jgi:cell division protein FtsI (penicillin-binding protein 3)/stage V sporulation protein D (sporulation-specific penicillin-binding protein)
MNKKNITIKWRAYIVLGTILLFALILIVRLYFVQIVDGDYYSAKADRQYLGPNSDIFDRGSIYFTSRDGSEIAAATLKTGYKIAVNPSIINNPEAIYNNLNMEVELDQEDFLHRLSKTDDPYEELAKRIDPDTAEKIIEKDLIGVSLFKEKWRFYPGQELASHATGFVSFHGDELRGQYGLEGQYEEVLNRNDEHVFSNFFVEIFSNLKSVVIDGENPKGSIVTTIEPTVQTFLEEELKDIDETWNSKKVGGIVMNPKNGEIYGMGLYPNFDLNTFNEVESAEIYTNNMVESVYEMGSIVKPLTMAIGLDTDSVTPETTYNDKGSKTLDGYTIYNYDLESRGVVDMQEVLSQSLNLGVSFVVDQVGNDVFAEYMKEMFSEKTGVDLPNESQALLSNLESRNDIEYATASFGQGIAMSPISVTRALAALGNGGYLVQPHLVKKIEYKNGFSKTLKYEKGEQIFKPETSEEISRMLVTVVDEALAGGNVALNNHSIAAKTGTAQIAKEAGGGYYDDRYLHSFFGYFPAYDPEFIVFLYVIEPQGAEFASNTLTDPFMNMAKFLINYYQIPPDREQTVADSTEI